MTAPLVMVWPGGEHAFRLGLGEIEGLQSATDCGPEHLLGLLQIGAWKTAHIEPILKFGLIGGGMSAVDAQRLVRATVDRGFGWAHYKPACINILQAALYGPEDDPVGESLAAPATVPPPHSPEESGAFRDSTA